MVESGIGYAITLDRLVSTDEGSALCFRPLKPKLESGLNIVWKKYQVFSPAAELFLERLKSREFFRKNACRFIGDTGQKR